LPFWRRPHHASGLRRELLGQRADARFETVCSQFGFGCFTGQVGELFVRDRECHMVRNTASDAQLPLVERVRTLRPEPERQHLIASGQVNRQRRTVTRRPNQIPELVRFDGRAGIWLFEIADDRAPASIGDHVLNLQPRGQGGPVSRRCLHDNLASVEKRERQKIVREYRCRDLRDLRKHPPDVEDRGQRAQQFVACLDVPHAVSLERE
jgi:hypothetical protein